jgi:hypothetical protein
MEKNKKEDVAIIQKLIQEEEDTAFRILTKKGLIFRLEERLKAEASKKATVSSWIKRPMPTFVFLLLIVFVFMIALLFILSPFQQKKGLETLEKYLQTTPGIQTLAQMGEQRKAAQTIERTEIFWLKGNLENLLESIYEEEGQKIGDTALLKHKEDLPTFNLEEKIRILLVEKEIHRFLNNYLGKKKEDKNDAKNLSFHFSHIILLESIWS